MLREALPKIVTGSVPGAKAKAILDRRNEAVPKGLCGSTYPICMEKGEGAMLEDVDGNKFLDWIGGVGVLNIGYSRPEGVGADATKGYGLAVDDFCKRNISTEFLMYMFMKDMSNLQKCLMRQFHVRAGK